MFGSISNQIRVSRISRISTVPSPYKGSRGFSRERQLRYALPRGDEVVAVSLVIAVEPPIRDF